MKGIAWTVLVAATLAASGCVTDEGGDAPPATVPAKKEPAKEPAKAAAIPDNPWKGTGFTVWEDKGRTWVFLEKHQDKELGDYLKGKEAEKRVTRVGVGPGGKTVHAVDANALDAYAAWKSGFILRATKDKDRMYLWVFKEGAKELADFDKTGDMAKHVTRLGVGPGGITLKAPDAATLDAWVAAKAPK